MSAGEARVGRVRRGAAPVGRCSPGPRWHGPLSGEAPPPRVRLSDTGMTGRASRDRGRAGRRRQRAPAIRHRPHRGAGGGSGRDSRQTHCRAACRRAGREGVRQSAAQGERGREGGRRHLGLSDRQTPKPIDGGSSVSLLSQRSGGGHRGRQLVLLSADSLLNPPRPAQTVTAVGGRVRRGGGVCRSASTNLPQHKDQSMRPNRLVSS